MNGYDTSWIDRFVATAPFVLVTQKDTWRTIGGHPVCLDCGGGGGPGLSKAVEDATNGKVFKNTVQSFGSGLGEYTQAELSTYARALEANNYETKHVPINELISTQTRVSAPSVDYYLSHPIEPVQVLDNGRGLFVQDGHHRVVAAYARGDKTVPVRVFNARS